jgi:hypothetical protein
MILLAHHDPYSSESWAAFPDGSFSMDDIVNMAQTQQQSNAVEFDDQDGLTLEERVLANSFDDSNYTTTDSLGVIHRGMTNMLQLFIFVITNHLNMCHVLFFSMPQVLNNFL